MHSARYKLCVNWGISTSRISAVKTVSLAMLSSIAVMYMRIFCDILHVWFCHFLLQELSYLQWTTAVLLALGKIWLKASAAEQGTKMSRMYKWAVFLIVPPCCFVVIPFHLSSLGKGSFYVSLKVGWECVMWFMARGRKSGCWYRMRRNSVLYLIMRPDPSRH